MCCFRQSIENVKDFSPQTNIVNILYFCTQVCAFFYTQLYAAPVTVHTLQILFTRFDKKIIIFLLHHFCQNRAFIVKDFIPLQLFYVSQDCKDHDSFNICNVHPGSLLKNCRSKFCIGSLMGDLRICVLSVATVLTVLIYSRLL